MKSKVRIFSVCFALAILFTACGSASEDLDTQNASVSEDLDLQDVSVEKENTDVVASPADSTEDTETEEVITEPQLTAEELEWQNYMMPNVEEDSLNVRAEANTEADLAGKLSKGDRAEVLEVGEEWTKIKSGNLEGYVKNEYCIYGLEALAYAKENCDTVATTTTDGLRIREEMNTDSKIVKRLDEGDQVVVDTAAEVEEGWVAVKYNDNTYYVSAEFVTVELQIGTGMTMEEIEEIRRQEAEAKAAAEAARAEAATQSASSQAAVASVDDLTLMAAIIYCEAGAESYDTQLAVGAVIMNRLESGAYPNTLYDVIYQRGQFGPAGSGKLARVIAEGKATSSCYQAAQAALAGQDNTGGCLFFNDYNGSREGLVIGGMVFW